MISYFVGPVQPGSGARTTCATQAKQKTSTTAVRLSRDSDMGLPGVRFFTELSGFYRAACNADAVL